MRYLTLLVTGVALLCSSATFAQDKIFSGPQPGEELKPFKVVQVNDERAIEEALIAQPDHEGIQLICFMHTVSEPAIGLFMNLEAYASDKPEVADDYVMLADDRERTEETLKRWNNTFFENAKMSFSLDGPEGPGVYGLNRNVTVTVLVAKDNKVVASFALQDPNQTDAPVVLKEVAKQLGKPAPTLEEVREVVQARRDRRRRESMAQNPVFKLAPNERLGQIMLRMLNTEGSREANAKRRKAEFVEWAGDNQEKLAILKEYCNAILNGDFEINDFSRKALQELVEDK